MEKQLIKFSGISPFLISSEYAFYFYDLIIRRKLSLQNYKKKVFMYVKVILQRQPVIRFSNLVISYNIFFLSIGGGGSQ